ncbi:MAG: hypothetical protein ABI797_02090 [Chloroflexota bacterium]
MAGAGIGFFFGLIGLAVLGFVNGPDPAQPEFVYCRRLAAWKSAMDTQSRLPR